MDSFRTTQPALEALTDLDIGTPDGASPEQAPSPARIPRTPPRRARPLKPAQVDELVVGYDAGKTTRELAAEFDINRMTVSAHLRRVGVPVRRLGLGAEQKAGVADLYEAGWSSERLAERFDVSADTIVRALRQSGSVDPSRRGGPRPKPPTAR